MENFPSFNNLEIKKPEAISEGYEIDVPGDNSCLFWAVALAYLLPVVKEPEVFQRRFRQLFGDEELSQFNHIHTLFQQYNPFVHTALFNDVSLNCLIREQFRRRIVDYMSEPLQKAALNEYWASENHIEETTFEDYLSRLQDFNTWGGDLEIKAFCELLACSIKVTDVINAFDQEFNPAVKNNMKGDLAQITLRYVNSGEDNLAKGNHYRWVLDKEQCQPYLRLVNESTIQSNLQINSLDDLDIQAASPISKIINSTLLAAKQYEASFVDTNKVPDKRILLELYGFALGLSKTEESEVIKYKIEHVLLKRVKAFVLEDLRIKQGVELANLKTDFSYFASVLRKIRRTKLTNASELKDFLASIRQQFEQLVNEMFEYVHDILGGPPIDTKYAILSVGSLATDMVTPYSDIEYVVIVDKLTDDNQTYFRNFGDLFELLMIGFGESPISHEAQQLLITGLGQKTFEDLYEKSFKTGLRVDARKKPQDFNRLYGLINTPENLIKKIPETIIYEPGNHLTAALLTVGCLDKGSSIGLYNTYIKLYEVALSTQEYANCLTTLLKEDKRSCLKLCNDLEEDYEEKQLVTKEIEIKNILKQVIHLAREWLIFLKVHDEKIVLAHNFFDIVNELRKHVSASDSLYDNIFVLVEKLFKLRIKLQTESKSASAKLKLEELNIIFPINKICQTFIKLIDNINQTLQDNNKILQKTLATIFSGTLENNYISQSAQSQVSIFEVPRVSDLFRGKKQPLEDMAHTLNKKDATKPVQYVVLTGLGGIGKTELTLKFAWENKTSFPAGCIFFSAEDKQSIHNTFSQIGKKMGVKNTNPNELSHCIYEALSRRGKSLIIFDDVIDKKQLLGFLPKNSYSSQDFAILITSRCRNTNEWGDWTVKLLDTVDDQHQQDCREYICAHLSCTEPEARKLAEELHYLPLALSQAVSFIRNYDNYTIKQYINLLKKDITRTKLFESLNVEDREKEHKRTILKVWNISINMLNNIQPQAYQVLCLAAFLYADNIPYILFRPLVMDYTVLDIDLIELELQTLISHLKRFSFIYPTARSDSFRMHRLLQEVIRDQLDANKLQTDINLCLKYLSIQGIYERNSVDNIKNITIHLNLLKQFITKYGVSIDSSLYSKLSYHIGLYFSDYELDHKTALSNFEEAYKNINNATVNELSFKIMRQLAKIYVFTNKLNKAKLIYQKLFTLGKEQINLDTNRNLTIYHKTLLDYHRLLKKEGKYDEAITLVEQVFQETNDPQIRTYCHQYLAQLYKSSANGINSLIQIKIKNCKNLPYWMTIKKEDLCQEIDELECELEDFMEKSIYHFNKAFEYTKGQVDYVGMVRSTLMLSELAFTLDSEGLFKKAVYETYNLYKNKLHNLDRQTYKKEYFEVIYQLGCLFQDENAISTMKNFKIYHEIGHILQEELVNIAKDFGEKSNEYKDYLQMLPKKLKQFNTFDSAMRTNKNLVGTNNNSPFFNPGEKRKRDEDDDERSTKKLRTVYKK